MDEGSTVSGVPGSGYRDALGGFSLGTIPMPEISIFP